MRDTPHNLARWLVLSLSLVRHLPEQVVFSRRSENLLGGQTVRRVVRVLPLRAILLSLALELEAAMARQPIVAAAEPVVAAFAGEARHWAGART